MTKTIFSSKLADEIVRSWEKKRSNFIIVAPPMSNIRSLFSEICDVNFSRNIVGDQANNFSIAKLDTNDFKDDLTFAKSVLKSWSLTNIPLDNASDAISLLTIGTAEVIRAKKIPIIVIHRFHEALEKLGEDIGTALRNLEHDQGLKTVVELPISLSCLRERWNSLDPETPPFLSSDWGQGHSLKFLKGYNVEEISNLLPNGNDEKTAKKIFSLAGGITQLTEHLIEFPRHSNDTALNEYAKSKASSLCDRLLIWIDKPRDDFYKRLVVLTLAQPNARQGNTSLRDHDWKDLLISNDGGISCNMIAWACSERLAFNASTWYEEHLISSLEKESPQYVFRLIDNLPSSNKIVNDKKEALKLLSAFLEAAGPYVDNWENARRILQQFCELAKFSDSEDVKNAWKSLQLWSPLIDLMCDFSYAKKSDPNLRLEEFSIVNRPVGNFFSLLQLLQLRLEKARTLTPYLALKSVVEQPESLLQLYSYKLVEVCFWKFEGMSDIEQAAISDLVKKPFRAPKKNVRLGFTEILYLIFLKLKQVNVEDRLFENHQELLEIEKLYEERKQQVHSTAFASLDNWTEYEKICSRWLTLLAKASKGERSLKLPLAIDIFSDLAKFGNKNII